MCWLLGVVILITFEGLRLHRALLSGIEWTAVCLDEGHKIRNPDAEVGTLLPYCLSFCMFVCQLGCRLLVYLSACLYIIVPHL